MTKAAALRLYAKACETHKRSDWRMACHALAEVLGAVVATGREPRAITLVEFLSVNGLADDGGEVAARDGDRWHKDRPFRRRLVREGGRSLEAAAEAAHDAGYFPDVPAATMDGPDNMHAVTPDRLLAAIDRELSGSPIYAGPDQDRDAAYWESMEPEEMERRA